MGRPRHGTMRIFGSTYPGDRLRTMVLWTVPIAVHLSCCCTLWVVDNHEYIGLSIRRSDRKCFCILACPAKWAAVLGSVPGHRDDQPCRER